MIISCDAYHRGREEAIIATITSRTDRVLVGLKARYEGSAVQSSQGPRVVASSAFRSRVQPQDIYCEGISRLGNRDFRYARELGFAIKLLAIAKYSLFLYNGL